MHFVSGFEFYQGAMPYLTCYAFMKCVANAMQVCNTKFGEINGNEANLLRST